MVSRALRKTAEQLRQHPPETTLLLVAPKGSGIHYVMYSPSCPLKKRDYRNSLIQWKSYMKLYQVPADVQAKLLRPLMSNQAKSIIGRMSSADLAEYDKVKQFLLSEFTLTPKEYKSRFDNASKTSDETFVCFTS